MHTCFPSILTAAFLGLASAATTATAQPVEFDPSDFGKIVIAPRQSTNGLTYEQAFGDDQNEPIIAYGENSPAVQLGRPVGRLDLLYSNGKTGYCTAFIVDNQHIVTNHHCVPGLDGDPTGASSNVEAAQFVAGYIQPGRADGADRFNVSPRIIETNRTLDYTVLRVFGDPSAKYGTLEIVDDAPQDGEFLWIIGHPAGQSQHISREGCAAAAPAVSDEGKLVHSCDTLGGNSGSPVIRIKDQKVVGLHHAGDNVTGFNFAIPMSRILAESSILLAAASDTGPEVVSDARPPSNDVLQSVLDEISNLNKRLGQQEGENTERQQALTALQSELESSSTALASEQAMVAALKAELEASKAERAAEEAYIAALQAQIEDLKQQTTTGGSAEDRARIAALESRLSDEELARLAESAAAEALRQRLRNADAELTAMQLALEEKRREAEDTLTLLAASNATEQNLQEKLAVATAKLADLDRQLSENDPVNDGLDAERKNLAALEIKVAALNEQLAEVRTKVVEGNPAKQTDVLRLKVLRERYSTARRHLVDARNQLEAAEAKFGADSSNVNALSDQVVSLRQQVGVLQAMLDEQQERSNSEQVQIAALGNQLNVALARVAAEERKRADLETLERKRLESAADATAPYQSLMLQQVRALFQSQITIVVSDDRVIIPADALFQPGTVNLSKSGRAGLESLGLLIRNVNAKIPANVDWVLQIAGHTDNQPMSGSGRYKDNWELSQARAITVVRHLIDDQGVPPHRLAASGFGEFQPINPRNTAAARAENRRIEIKLTEK